MKATGIPRSGDSGLARETPIASMRLPAPGYASMPKPPMHRRRRMLLVLLTIALCVGLDQYTKSLARSHLPKSKAISIAKDTLRLDYLENKGAVLSFEHYLPDHWRGPTVTVAVAGFLAVLIPFLVFGAPFRAGPTVWLSLLAGGTLSNMLDRVALGGDVVDFLNLGWGAYRTCIFNVADAAIVSGSVLFTLSALMGLGSIGTKTAGRSLVGR